MDKATEAAIEQLDAVIQDIETDVSRTGAARTARHTARMLAIVARLTAPNSVYQRQANELGTKQNEYSLRGVVKALRDDVAAGYTKSFREIINADLFSDFLTMAEHLLAAEKLKQPAAVLAGGVLEVHIRKLCDRNGVATTLPDGKPKKLDTMNADLAKADVYQKNVQKQLTAWCGIRNSAAHAKFDEFEEIDVRHMIAGLRDFVGRFPC